MFQPVKQALFKLLRRLVRRRAQTRRLNDPLRKILIIQLQNLGDSLIFIPALRALRSAHAEAQIHMLVNAISSQVYRHCPYVDRFWLLRRRRLLSAEVSSLVVRLRREKFDAVLLDVTHQAFAYNLLALLVGARERVGFDWEGRGAFCTVRLPAPCTSYRETNLELVRRLGKEPGEEPDATAPEFWITDLDRVFIAQLLAQLGIADDDILICIHPGSNMQSKRWFPDRFARVIEAVLGADPRRRVLLTGAAAEAGLANEIIIRVRDHRLLIQSGRLASLAGKTSLHQLAALYERARLLVTVDSGPQHLAAALGTAMVVLMSAQDLPGRWTPPASVDHAVLRRDAPCSPCRLSVCPLPRHDCMADIAAAEVVAAIEKQLRRVPVCMHT